ncbi:hypothetical protein [Achromobacter denitrificans]|uniref:hypothetical protein n=1 Tax=Achromobacter denitrificans TaxID=32002 RepID=UPI0012F9F281|nr:hypothetical protein [Achromobacter denitrificans]
MNDGLAGSRIAGLRKRHVAHKNLGRNSQQRIKCLPAKQRIDDRTISPDPREPEFAFAASQARRCQSGRWPGRERASSATFDIGMT